MKKNILEESLRDQIRKIIIEEVSKKKVDWTKVVADGKKNFLDYALDYWKAAYPNTAWELEIKILRSSFEGKRLLIAMKQTKFAQGTILDVTGSVDMLEAFAYLSQMINSLKEARRFGKYLRLGSYLSDRMVQHVHLGFSSKLFLSSKDKFDKDDLAMFESILKKAGIFNWYKLVLKFLDKKKKFKARRKRRAAKPKLRGRYKNRKYVEAVQILVNHYITRGTLNIPRLTVDRSYGEKTRKGVEALQKAFKIKPADGYFGPATACAISKKLGMTADNNCRKPEFIINLVNKLREIETLPPPPSEDDAKRLDALYGGGRAIKETRLSNDKELQSLMESFKKFTRNN